MTRSTELQVALNQIRHKELQLRDSYLKIQDYASRLTRIKLMMQQLSVQANSLPSDDPVRAAFEGFIGAVNQLANGARISSTTTVIEESTKIKS